MIVGLRVIFSITRGNVLFTRTNFFQDIRACFSGVQLTLFAKCLENSVGSLADGFVPSGVH